jgi:hypothetical protein
MTSLCSRQGCYKALGGDSGPIGSARIARSFQTTGDTSHGSTADSSLRPKRRNLNSTLCGDRRQIDGAKVTKGNLEAIFVIKPRLKQGDLVSRALPCVA